MAANAEYNGLARDRKHGVEQRHDGFLFCISYFGIFLKRIMLNILALNRKGGVEQDYQEYNLLQISKVVKVTS